MGSLRASCAALVCSAIREGLGLILAHCLSLRQDSPEACGFEAVGCEEPQRCLLLPLLAIRPRPKVSLVRDLQRRSLLSLAFCACWLGGRRIQEVLGVAGSSDFPRVSGLGGWLRDLPISRGWFRRLTAGGAFVHLSAVGRMIADLPGGRQ